MNPLLTDAIGVAGALLTTFCWLPQVVKIVRERDTSAISFPADRAGEGGRERDRAGVALAHDFHDLRQPAEGREQGAGDTDRIGEQGIHRGPIPAIRCRLYDSGRVPDACAAPSARLRASST